MNKIFICLISMIFIISCNSKETTQVKAIQKERPAYAIVIHGGAGTILKANMSDEKEKEYMDAMNAALDIGEQILKNGGTSMDAVEKTIHYMEDSPLFNAGKGAVFTNAGQNEHDASIMSGVDQNAGATGGTTNIKHPISAARAVLEKSVHVMLTGTGAEEFAKQEELEMVDPKYFHTDRRWNSLQKVKKKELAEMTEDEKHGTVGCVALDNQGNIVAGTSTGGMTNKKFNRIGDAPIIGAGTYADNATCGISCTGHGEYFIRYAAAHEVSARMKYTGENVIDAAEYVVNDLLVEKKGSGGLVGLDREGNIAMPFNSAGMYRGYAKPNERVVKIYKD